MSLPAVLITAVIMLYFRSEFLTRAEAKILEPLPIKIEQIEIRLVPLDPLPARLQLLEERTSNQALENAKRDAQLEKIAASINTLSIQQAQVLQKVGDMDRRTERVENKLDGVARKIE